MATKKKVIPAGLDIEADAGVVAKPEELAAIIALAKRAYRLQMEIEKAVEDMNKKVEELNLIELDTLPQRMRAAGLKEFKLSNDYIVAVTPFIRASLPTVNQIEEAEPLDKVVLQRRRDEGLKWLRKHGGIALMKTTLKAEFGKGEEEAAAKFEKQIIKSGYHVKKDSNINFNTLKAFIKERLAEGIEVPVEPFALFNGSKAVIKKVKE